jgi:hypothetical protein
MDRNTLDEIKNMIQQKRGTIQATIKTTHSLRSGNPSIRVPASIYDGGNAMAINDMDVASVIAPSEIQFEFDDLVVNSQAYRRVFAQARARFGSSGDRGPLEQQTTAGLVDVPVPVSAMAKPSESSTTQLTPVVIEDLRGLSLGASADYPGGMYIQGTAIAAGEPAGLGVSILSMVDPSESIVLSRPATTRLPDTPASPQGNHAGTSKMRGKR